MRSLEEVLRDARKYGVRCSKRTFWKYHGLGLLPKGEKIAGRGNVVYFPDDTYKDLWMIQFLTDELGFSLSLLERIRLYESRKVQECMKTAEELPSLPLSKSLLKGAKSDAERKILTGITAALGRLRSDIQHAGKKKSK